MQLKERCAINSQPFVCETHSLRVLTTVDLAGPRSESMMRIHGLQTETLSFQRTLNQLSWLVSLPQLDVTHCLQRFGLEPKQEASELTESSARVPSSLHSSWTDTHTQAVD